MRGRYVVMLVVGVGLVAVAVWLVWSTRPIPVTQGPATPVTPATTALPTATTPTMPAATASHVDGGRPARTGPPSVVAASGGWGSGPGQFGRRRDPESNPEAPMAITVAADGTLLVLDQINRRVQRWKDGKLVGSMPFGGDTVQDVVAGPEGRTVLLDRLADRNLQIYDPTGKLLNEVSLVGKGVPEGGGVTAVFADDDGVYVEREHGAVVRIADVNGHPDPARPELIGRPSRDGKLLLSAALADRGAGTVSLRAFDRKTSQPVWSTVVSLGAPILHVITLDSDTQGAVYLAASTGAETTTAPFHVVDEAIVVTRLTGGQQRGLLTLPPFATADETFRPITVADDGTLYVEYVGENGVEVRRYRF